MRRPNAAIITFACTLTAAAMGGCEFFRKVTATAKPGELPEKPHVQPLAVQQARAYQETVTGVFLSLADFEDAPDSPPGHRQVGYFSFHPAGGDNRKQFVVNVTRTGAGAMETTLAPNCELVFDIPYVHDFTGYTLLSMAVFSESLRDDLRVTLTTDAASWRSHRTLVRPGWNNVLIDIQRLAGQKGFDITGVRTMRLAFADAAGAVRFYLDDIMLIDNGRTIRPVPTGMSLTKTGLDYKLTGGGFQPAMPISQGADGLWRVGPYQPAVQILPPPRAPVGRGQDLSLMGTRRVGAVRIAENNPLRLRIVNTWYFPTRAGEWVSLAVRQIRWEYTFYADGRWVTHVELNNAGGKEIAAVKFSFPRAVAAVGAGIADELVARGLLGPIGRWDYLWTDDDRTGRDMMANYLAPAKLKVTLADEDSYADGDVDRDRFDQTRGCYFLRANRGGHCRFRILPGPQGLASPVFRVAGYWKGKVSVSSDGMRVRDAVRLADGSVLFILPGRITRQTNVEVTGQTPPLTK